MKINWITFLSPIVLGGCTLLAPYTITFTTPSESVIDPLNDTLDLVLSQPAMAYISEVNCQGYDPVTLLPVVSESMKNSNVHNLSLEVLNSYEPATKCELKVSAFDQSTTSSTMESISLYVLEKPELNVEETPDYSDNIQACNAAGGEWNACASSCEEGDDLCVQVCVPKCEFTSSEESNDIQDSEESDQPEKNAEEAN